MSRAANERIAHLAVRAPNWVGDLAMATPVLHAASEVCERLSVVVRQPLAGLLEGGALESRLVRVGRGREELAQLHALAPDAILLLTNSFGAAWRAWRAGIPLRAGSALSGRRFFLTHRVVPPTSEGRRVPIPTAHLYRDLAGLVGIAPRGVDPVLDVDARSRAEVRGDLEAQGLRAGEPYVVCTPGAAFGAAKLWPLESFAAALDGLHTRHGWRAVVSGGPGEEALIAALVRLLRHPAISLAARERSLGKLKALVAGAELLLVGDSGPRWVAAAFRVPCVTVMGPNFPELTASSLELCEVVRRDDLECSPCLQRVCPLGHHRCMVGLPVEHVLSAAERVIAKKRARP